MAQCLGPSCTRTAKSFGLCNSHYQQKRLGKEPTKLRAWVRRTSLARGFEGLERSQEREKIQDKMISRIRKTMPKHSQKIPLEIICDTDQLHELVASRIRRPKGVICIVNRDKEECKRISRAISERGIGNVIVRNGDVRYLDPDDFPKHIILNLDPECLATQSSVFAAMIGRFAERHSVAVRLSLIESGYRFKPESDFLTSLKEIPILRKYVKEIRDNQKKVAIQDKTPAKLAGAQFVYDLIREGCKVNNLEILNRDGLTKIRFDEILCVVEK